jgi:hypothetical protein
VYFTSRRTCISVYYFVFKYVLIQIREYYNDMKKGNYDKSENLILTLIEEPL